MNTPRFALPSAKLLAAIRNAALSIAATHARRLADAIADYEQPDGRARSAGTMVAPVPAFRRAASAVFDAWTEEPAVHGAIVGAALLSAIETAEAMRASQSLDVVWTGPSTAEVPVRLTREALLELIDGATSSLIIVSYAAYKVPDIVQALADAVARGVDVRLILESTAGSGGRLSVDASQAFSAVAGVRFYGWPAEQRESDGGLKGSMHAKVVVADDQVAFVTSANLTGSAIEANMELGVLARGGAVPRRLSRHFRMLIAAGTLVEVGG